MSPFRTRRFPSPSRPPAPTTTSWRRSRPFRASRRPASRTPSPWMATTITTRSSPRTSRTPMDKFQPCAATSTSHPAISKPWGTHCWPAVTSPGPTFTRPVASCWSPNPWRDPAAALGKQVRENPKAPWREVVGVVGNERDDGADHKATAIVYWPMMLRDFWGQPLIVQRGQAFAIRSPRTGSASLLNEVRRAVWSVNPDLPIAGVRTMQEVYDRSMARTAFTLVMLSIAAGMALLLGIVGIYGVISYAVSQRTREIGIRIALGAPPQSVRQMFVREGLLMTAIGVVCGLAAAAGPTRLMKALLFEVSPLDPATYGAVSLVLAAAALLASDLPPPPPAPCPWSWRRPGRCPGAPPPAAPPPSSRWKPCASSRTGLPACPQ